MKTTILFSIVVFLIFSCVPKRNVKRGTEFNTILPYTDSVVKGVEIIYFNDQKYRRLSSLLPAVNKSICDTTEFGIKMKQSLSAVDDMNGFYLAPREDSLNTLSLIKITRRYGYPTLKDPIHKVPAFLIFMHAHKYHFPEIREIVVHEFENGRMLEFEKNKILWHLDGRPFGEMPEADRDIYYYSDTEVFKYLYKLGYNNLLKQAKKN